MNSNNSEFYTLQLNEELRNLRKKLGSRQIEVANLFNNYGYISELDIPVDQTGTASSQIDLRLSFNIKFYSFPHFRRFYEDLTSLEKAADEEYIRERNPAVRQAWEEYQLLLKLTR